MRAAEHRHRRRHSTSSLDSRRATYPGDRSALDVTAWVSYVSNRDQIHQYNSQVEAERQARKSAEAARKEGLHELGRLWHVLMHGVPPDQPAEPPPAPRASAGDAGLADALAGGGSVFAAGGLCAWARRFREQSWSSASASTRSSSERSAGPSGATPGAEPPPAEPPRLPRAVFQQAFASAGSGNAPLASRLFDMCDAERRGSLSRADFATGLRP